MGLPIIIFWNHNIYFFQLQFFIQGMLLFISF
jgi:hypothetical protein